MEDALEPSPMARFASFVFFITFTAACFIWFTASAYDTIASLFNDQPIIVFSKGAMYALGGGITALMITILGAYQTFNKSTLSEKNNHVLTKMLIASTIFMFLFPVVAHYAIDKAITAKRYSKCEEMSYQWLLYQKIVYVENMSFCNGKAK